MRHRHERRFAREIARLKRALPWARCFFEAGSLVRIPLALLFIFGGVLWFLPFVGLWMLPIGLLLLAFDLPALRPLVAATAIRLRYYLRTRFGARKANGALAKGTQPTTRAD